MKEQDVVNIIERLLKKSIIRKFGASVNHRLLGYTYNGMLVLNVSEDKIDFIANFICNFSEVSHCYQREKTPNSKINWPYNLFAMIHGKKKEDCEYIANKIVSYGSIEDYSLIYSIKELKKTGIRL